MWCHRDKSWMFCWISELLNRWLGLTITSLRTFLVKGALLLLFFLNPSINTAVFDIVNLCLFSWFWPSVPKNLVVWDKVGRCLWPRPEQSTSLLGVCKAPEAERVQMFNVWCKIWSKFQRIGSWFNALKGSTGCPSCTPAMLLFCTYSFSNHCLDLWWSWCRTQHRVTSIWNDPSHSESVFCCKSKWTFFFSISANFHLFFLLCQTRSATWTSPSSTWNWTVFLTWPTSPPSGTQWRYTSQWTAGRTLRRRLRAQCYDTTMSSCDAAAAAATTPLHPSPPPHPHSWIAAATAATLDLLITPQL